MVNKGIYPDDIRCNQQRRRHRFSQNLLISSDFSYDEAKWFTIIYETVMYVELSCDQSRQFRLKTPKLQ